LEKFVQKSLRFEALIVDIAKLKTSSQQDNMHAMDSPQQRTQYQQQFWQTVTDLTYCSVDLDKFFGGKRSNHKTTTTRTIDDHVNDTTRGTTTNTTNGNAYRITSWDDVLTIALTKE